MAHDCRAHHKNNLVVKFADDAVVVGLITRLEVEDLARWCGENNIILNIQKTKEVVDFRRSGITPPPLHINGAAVEISVRYLGVNLTNTLT